MIFQPGGNIHVLDTAGVYLLKVNNEYWMIEETVEYVQS